MEPPPHPGLSEEQHELEGDEAFIATETGELNDGEVLADLDDNAEAPVDTDDEDDAEGAGGSTEIEMHEDDSVHTFEGHTSGIYAAAWSPAAPDLVATGGADDRAFLWRVGEDAFRETGGDVAELAGHTDTVCALAFSADGAMLATGGMDGRVLVWDAASGKQLGALEGPGDSVEWVAWHPRGGVVLAGASDFSAWMWLAASGACMQVFSGHRGPVTCGGFTPDGKLAVTGGGEGDASLRVWDPRTGECRLTVSGKPFHSGGVTCLDVHPDSSAVLTGSEDGTACIVSLATGRVVGALAGGHGGGDDTDEGDTAGSVEAAAFSRRLPGVALTGGMDGGLVVWDIPTATVRATCEHPDGVTRLAEHPSQTLVLSGCLDGVVRCWDQRTGGCVRTLRGHTDAVQALAVSADGRWVLSGSEDGTARVFSLGG